MKNPPLLPRVLHVDSALEKWLGIGRFPKRSAYCLDLEGRVDLNGVRDAWLVAGVTAVWLCGVWLCLCGVHKRQAARELDK